MVILRNRPELYLALFVVMAGVAFASIREANLWRLDATGLSLVSAKLPYWDFSNLWAGSVMAWKGHVGYLFDVETYRAELRHIFSPRLPAQEWSYPPSILLLGLPFAALPLAAAYWLWTIGTVVALHFAIRPLAFPSVAHIAVLLSPSLWMNALLGQNGALTAALLIGGLWLAPRRPLVAGFLLGVLTIKPHLGLLVPVALLASRNYRAIFSAALTAVVMIGIAGLLFGFDIWRLFLTQTAPLMAAIMEAPYPQAYQSNAVTSFVLGRWLGLGISGAYLLQGLSSLVAAAAVYWLWKPSSAVDHARRVCLTAAMSILATPYAYSYDTIPVGVAVAFFFLTEPRVDCRLMAIVWLYPLFLNMAIVWLYPLFLNLVNSAGIGVSVLVPASFMVCAFWVTWRDAQSRAAASTASRLAPDL